MCLTCVLLPGPQVLALQQQPVPHLTCTHAAGATVFCTVKPPSDGSQDSVQISVQCTSLAGQVAEITAEGQVKLCNGHMDHLQCHLTKPLFCGFTDGL